MPVEWRKFPPGEKYLDFDWIHENIPRVHKEDMSRGWCLRHPNTTFRYNPTVPARVALVALSGLMSNLENRWDFHVVKVDEWIEISPSHPMYASIVRQKYDLIRQVKEGLAHVDRAVSDVELLAHDARKYREILGYFAKNDEHSLRALFIDYVDAHLPEGVSMRTIAPRWPTIIADFQALDLEDDTPEKIMEKIDVSKAEAMILATKMRLYKRWRELFGSEVRKRYRRIIERLEGRKASIEEYRNWIRPLIRRVLQMREVEDKTLAMHSHLPIGAGMPVALQYIEYWAWTSGEGLEPSEHHKVPRELHVAPGTGMLPGLLKLKVREGKTPRFRIEPYDDVVKSFIPYIEKKHGVKITKDDVLEARKRLYELGSPTWEWYVLAHFPVSILHYKLPTGLDVEDVDFDKLGVVFLTQNIMLVKLLELIAEEKKIDAYIDELLGKRVMIDGTLKKIDELLKEEFPEIYGKKKEEKKPFLSEFLTSLKKSFMKFEATLNKVFGFKFAFTKGPYDPFFHDRLTYSYGRPFMREVFEPLIWSYMLKNFGGV